METADQDGPATASGSPCSYRFSREVSPCGSDLQDDGVPWPPWPSILKPLTRKGSLGIRDANAHPPQG